VNIEAEFVTSAATKADFPQTGIPEIVLVGRSNVGKSSLINALVRRRVARTSAAPGKTRLANIYRVERGSTGPMYLVDLPGYGYARGGAGAARAFDELARGYFGREGQERRDGQKRREGQEGEARRRPGAPAHPALRGALLLVDARHPGLEADLAAWKWLTATISSIAVVATKIDKLARGERIRALRRLESVFCDPVAAVSAVTGEGLDELWKLIDKLANNPNRNRHSSRPNRQTEVTARRPPDLPENRGKASG
jgi:GTP-binding protein